MKAIILAAGFGTRLCKEILDDDSGLYDHLSHLPKPLMPIGKQPLISHWIPILKASNITEIYVVTNGSNHYLFEEWVKIDADIKLLSDESITNETRSGAVGCIQLAVDGFNISDDTIVIGGDTLFDINFDLKKIMEKYEGFKKSESDANLVLTVPVHDEAVHLYGILEVDEHFLVTSFIEKPKPSETLSRKSCPCFYILNKSSIPLLQDFLEERMFLSKESRDATGHFLKYLCSLKPVYAVDVNMRFDVGNLESYITCNKYYSELTDSAS